MNGSRTIPWRRGLVVFTVAAAAGSAALLALPPERYFLDENEYAGLAATLLESGRFGTDGARAFRAPGYPAFAAAVFAAFGERRIAVAACQIVLAGIAALLTFALGLRFLGPAVAFRGALASAIYPPLLLYEQLLTTELLFTVAILATLLAFTTGAQRGSRPWSLCAGVFGAASVYVRPAALGFIVLLVGLLALRRFRNRAFVLHLCLLLLAASLCLLPWHLRNGRILGDATVFATSGGLNFWVGNNPLANGTQIAPERRTLPVDRAEHRAVMARDELTRDRLFREKGLSFLADQPLRALSLVPAKLSFLWNAAVRDVVFLWSQGRWGSRESVPLGLLLALVTIPFAVLIPLALRGWLRIPREEAFWGITAFLAFLSLFAVAFFGDHRYLVPAAPLLCLLASAGLPGTEGAPLPRWRSAAWVALCALFLLNVGWRAASDLRLYSSMVEKAPGHDPAR